MVSGYDIIGDVHGRADELEALLKKMGYQKNSYDVFNHPNRVAIFVGDLINKGNQQQKTIDIVRGMVKHDFAKAVMGNHEFNAICFTTLFNAQTNEYVRPHTRNNYNQQRKFLREFEFKSEKHLDQIAWFKTMPLFISLGDILIAHACFCPDIIKDLNGYLSNDNTLIESAYTAKDIHRKIGTILKGPDIKLPYDFAKQIINGKEYSSVLFKWWTECNIPTSKRLRYNISNLSASQIKQLNAIQISLEFNLCSKPIFIGNYGMKGDPSPLADKICCVDYSGSNKLIAYRWNGEDKLNARNFVI